MAFYLLRAFAFLALIALVARTSHAAAAAAALLPRPSTQLDYWNSVLPETPMPKALSQLVQPAEGLVRPADQDEADSTAADNPTRMYKDGENEDAPAGNVTWRYGKGGENEDAPGGNVTWRYGKGGENEDAPGGNVTWRYGKGDYKDDAPSGNATWRYGKGDYKDDAPSGNVTWRYGKGDYKDDAPSSNITWRYGKGGENEDAPGGNVTWRYGMSDNKDDAPSGNVTWRYGKGDDKDDDPTGNVTWRYGKGDNKDDSPGGNVTWRYGKSDNKDDSPAGNVTWRYGKDFKNIDAPADNQHNEEPARVIAFLEKDVHPGKTMKCSLTSKSDSSSNFLSRSIADSIPFSSGKLPEILKRLSVRPGSLEANKIRETIQDCEGPAVKGEDKYCATSLESMIDYATSKLGRNVQVVSSEVEEGAMHLQNYTIELGVKKLARDAVIVCHKMEYAYAVFYCHQVKHTRAYMVPLVGADGTHAKAVAICHLDTSAWNPNHAFLQELKIKPGTLPVCHFPPEGNIVWVPKQQKHALYSTA